MDRSSYSQCVATHVGLGSTMWLSKARNNIVLNEKKVIIRNLIMSNISWYQNFTKFCDLKIFREYET